MLYFIIACSLLVVWALLRLLGGERDYRLRVLQHSLAKEAREATERRRTGHA